MPLYDYKCLKCGAEFTFLKLKETDKPVCTVCGSSDAEKKVSSFSCSISGGIARHSGGC